MFKIAIRNESLSKRCEICHQVDCYDPRTNRCSRCDEIKDNQIQHFQLRESGKRRRAIGSNYYWYRYAANLYLAFAGIPSLLIFGLHINSLLPINFFLFIMLCIGFALLFLGLSVIVHDSAQGTNIWKVIGGALICAVTMAI